MYENVSVKHLALQLIHASPVHIGLGLKEGEA